MKIFDLKKVRIILLAMFLFLSIQVPVHADDHIVRIPVEQMFDSEAADVSDEFYYIMTTDQSDAPMPAGSTDRRYSWKMKNNTTAEITISVTTAGEYHYRIYQVTEQADDYIYDQSSYGVIVEAYYNEHNQLKVAAVIVNEQGEKIERITFKNKYVGQDKSDPAKQPEPDTVSKPDTKPKPDKSKNAKTGDDTPVMGYFILLLGSEICLGAIILLGHPRRKKEDA